MTRADNCGDHLGVLVISSDAVVLGITDQQASFSVHRDVLWSIEFGLQSKAAISRIALLTGAGQRRDFARRINLADRMACTFKHEDVAFCIASDGTWIDQWFLDRLATFRWFALLAVTCDRRNDSRFHIDATNPPIGEIKKNSGRFIRRERDRVHHR